MANARHTQITSRHTIADTFVHLLRRIDEVTLQFENSPVRYPVSIVFVDRAGGRCLLEIVGLDDVDCAFAQAQAFVLHIRQLAGTTTTSPMQCTAIESWNPDGVQIWCMLPVALMLSRHRNDFRAALAQTLKVDATLRAGDGKEYAGRLCNLSVGGGLVRLPDAQARNLEARNWSCRLGVRFPSGDRLKAHGYVRRVYRPSSCQFTYVGVAFDADIVDDKQRGIWFYVREIEREVMRRTHAPRGMRALSPSPLFAGDPKTESRPESVSAMETS